MRLAVSALVVAALLGGVASAATGRVAGPSADLSITVTNAGPDEAHEVVVKAVFPVGFPRGSLQCSIGFCHCKGLTCTVSDIRVGGQVYLGAGALVREAISTGRDKATIEAADESDPNVSNNSASAAVSSYFAVADSAFEALDYTRTTFGQTVIWHFTGSRTHTVTDATGLGLFDSGPQSPGSTYSFRYRAAGVFTFADTIHGFTGSILFSPKAKPSSLVHGGAVTVTWADAAPPAGDVFDVQVQAPGSSSFVDWQTGVTATSSSFATTVPGTYSFRARLRKPSGGSSEFSPTVAAKAT